MNKIYSYNLDLQNNWAVSQDLLEIEPTFTSLLCKSIRCFKDLLFWLKLTA